MSSVVAEMMLTASSDIHASRLIPLQGDSGAEKKMSPSASLGTKGTRSVRLSVATPNDYPKELCLSKICHSLLISFRL